MDKTKEKMPKNKKTVKGWGGFLSNKLDMWHDYITTADLFAIYKTKSEASSHYEDVRRVEITYQIPKRNKKR